MTGDDRTDAALGGIVDHEDGVDGLDSGLALSSGSRAFFPVALLRRRFRSRTLVSSTTVFVVVLVGGLVFRLLALRTGLAQQNSDTAVVYLMARHVAHGDLRVFYWGQSYGGTMIQLATGAVFWLIGPSFPALQAVEIAFWLASSLIFRSIVAKSCGRLAGDVSASVFWLAAPYVVTISFSDPGFYGDGLVLGLAAIRVVQGDWRRPELQALTMGFVFGLGFWTTPLTLAFSVPAALLLLVRLRSLPSLFYEIAGGVVGAAPWIRANARTGFPSFHRLAGGAGGSMASRYVHVFTELVPPLGGYGPTSTPGRLLAAAFVLTLTVGVIFAAWKRNAAMLLLGLSGLLLPAAVAASGVTVAPASVRYATLMVPAVLGILAWALNRRGLVILLLLGCLLPVWTAATLWNETDGLRPVADPEVGAPVALLGRYLEREDRRAVWGDYWVSYLLSAATQERVAAAALGVRRYFPYEDLAMVPRRTAVVLFAGGANDQTLSREPNLPSHTRTLVGPYAVWDFAARFEAPNYLTAVSVP